MTSAAGERLQFQLTFRGDDDYESRLHQALRLLPRGYAKLVFLRVMRRTVPEDATVEQMRRLMESVVTAPAMDVRAATGPPTSDDRRRITVEPKPRAPTDAASATQNGVLDSLSL
jgi:hypothetical protein